MANWKEGTGSRTEVSDTVPLIQCGAGAAVFEPEGKATATDMLVLYC